MNPITTIFSLVLFPIVIGRLTLGLIGLRAHLDHVAALSWSWMTGALWIAGSVFLLAATIGVRSPHAFLIAHLVPIAVLGLLLFAERARRLRSGVSASRMIAFGFAHPRPAGLLLASVGYALFAFALWTLFAFAVESNTAFILSGDELYIWLGKAKAIWVSGGLNDRFRELLANEAKPFPVDHADYPLLNPLLQLFVFMGRGEVTHYESRLPMQIGMLMLAVALFAAVRRRSHPLVAGAAAVLLTASQWSERLSGLAYSDHLAAFGFLVMTDAALRARETGDMRYRVVAGIAAVFMMAAKNEGQLLLAAALAASAVFLLLERRRAPAFSGARTPFTAIALPVGFILLHTITNRRFGLANDLIAGRDGMPFYRLFFVQWKTHAPVVFSYLSAAFTTILPPWRIESEANDWLVRRTHHFALVPGALLVAAIIFRSNRRSLAIGRALLSVVLAFLGFAAVYIGTPRPLVWHLLTSMFRVLYTIFPTCAFLLGVILFPRLENPKMKDAPKT